MNPRILASFAAALCVIAMVGCSSQKESAATTSLVTTAEQPEKSNEVAANDQESQKAPVRKINFDLSKIEDPLLNDEIKTSLQNLMDGVVQQDTDLYASAFPSPSDSDYAIEQKLFGIQSEDSITFTGIGKVTEQSGRIEMPLKYTIAIGGSDKPTDKMLYFVTDKNGTWKLGSID
ncbi:hypothetical protein [Paenibacillus sp. Z6-24]